MNTEEPSGGSSELHSQDAAFLAPDDEGEVVEVEGAPESENDDGPSDDGDDGDDDHAMDGDSGTDNNSEDAVVDDKDHVMDSNADDMMELVDDSVQGFFGHGGRWESSYDGHTCIFHATFLRARSSIKNNPSTPCA